MTKKQIFWQLILLICGIAAGFLAGRFLYRNPAENGEGCGIESQSLTVSQVEWEEYPSYRKVSFVLDGEFSLNVPAGSVCLLKDMEDASDLEEVGRKAYFVWENDGLTRYERVQFRVHNAKIQPEGLLKGEDAVHDAISGYRLTAVFDGEEEVLGYLPPSEDCFQVWSGEENEFSAYYYEMYLEHFELSETNPADKSMNAGRQAEDGLRLIKEDENVLSCIIDNTNGQSDWEYRAQLPTVELWYQGAWLKLDSPFEDNLAVSVCPQGESREISVPEETMKQYSYFLPGIYRLVLWGTDGSYIASDSFVIEKSP